MLRNRLSNFCFVGNSLKNVSRRAEKKSGVLLRNWQPDGDPVPDRPEIDASSSLASISFEFFCTQKPDLCLERLVAAETRTDGGLVCSNGRQRERGYPLPSSPGDFSRPRLRFSPCAITSPANPSHNSILPKNLQNNAKRIAETSIPPDDKAVPALWRSIQPCKGRHPAGGLAPSSF